MNKIYKKTVAAAMSAVIALGGFGVFAEDLSGFNFGETENTAASGSGLSGFDFGDSESSGNNGGGLSGFDFGGDAPDTNNTADNQEVIVNIPEVSEDTVSKEQNIEEEFSEAYALLCTLGIFDSDAVTDTTKCMTRHDFAYYAAKLMQLTPAQKVTFKFTDIDPADPMAPYIQSIVNADIMVGFSDEFFVASEIITFEQVMKVFVKMGGYGIVAEAKGGYSSAYTRTASDEGISNGVKSDGKGITNGNIMRAMYNLLFTDLMDIKSVGDSLSFEKTGENFIGKYFDVYKHEGVFNEYYGTNLYGISYCSEDEIAVDSTYYKLDGSYVCPFELLGRFVTAYIRTEKDNENILILLTENKNKSNYTLKVSHKDLNSVGKNGKISYKDNGKVKSENISKEAYVVYNGAYLGKLSEVNESIFKIKSGAVEFIDSDSIKGYNIAVITEYESFIAESVNKSTKRVNLKNGRTYNGLTYIDLNTEKNIDLLAYYYINGERGQFENISAGSVISIAGSKNSYGKKIYTVYICSEKLKDSTLEQLSESDSSVVISGEQYDLAADWGSGNAEKIEVGMTTTMLFTYFNEFFGIDTSSSTAEVLYAYVTDAKMFGSMDRTIRLKMLDSDGKWIEPKCADKFKVKHTYVAADGTNGSYAQIDQRETTYDSSKFDAFLEELNSVIFVKRPYDTLKRKVGALMAYKLDSDGNISEIEISDDLSSAQNYKGYNSTYFSLDYVVDGTSLRSYDGGLGPRMFFDTKTKGIKVQKNLGTIDGGIFRENPLNEKYYKVSSYAGIYSDARDGYLTYSRIYNVGPDRMIGFIVKEEESESLANLTIDDYNFAVSDITLCLDNDGETVWKVSGMKKGNPYSVYLPYDRTEVKEMPSGDASYGTYYRGSGWDPLTGTAGDPSEPMTAAELRPGDILEIGIDSLNFMTAFIIQYRIGMQYEEKWTKVSGGRPAPIEKDSKMAEMHTVYGVITEKAGNTAMVHARTDGDHSWDKAGRFANTSCMIMEYDDSGTVTLKKGTAEDFATGDEVLFRSWYHTLKSAIVIRKN